MNCRSEWSASSGAGPGQSCVALDDGLRTWSRADLQHEVQLLAERLAAGRTKILATLMDNSPAWVVADLAASLATLTHVPLPTFFTAEQIAHALQSAGVDTLLVPAALAVRWPKASEQTCDVAGQSLAILRLSSMSVEMPPGTAKITFTSGTTGTPKGVCLDARSIRQVSDSLVRVLEPLGIRRHLCALPFAVLLENIAGLMAPLAHGATCITLPLHRLGLTGSSTFDPAVFHDAVVQYQPQSVILLPQMLRAWVGHVQQSGQRAPGSLKLVAVGGAAVGGKLIHAARALGIPAYEGYGLSEGASVQTLNLPGSDCPGSAGRPLPHARVRVTGDGEIEITGSLFAGYLGDPTPPSTWWPTGDLGWIDADCFLHIHGRKKHLLITTFGRNVSPEWVETALCSSKAIVQAVVFGDAEPALSAVLWPVQSSTPDAVLQSAVDAINAGLPDYARVQRWVRARAAFAPESGLATANGRPQRAAIWQAHADDLKTAILETT
jgi:long-chain acyl-CoA synthetase